MASNENLSVRSAAPPRQRFGSEPERWAALQARDTLADGHFFFGVLTTGVYCRPSCGARRARPENVRFYDDTAAARAAGLRACRRCRPDGVGQAAHQAALIAQACRLIDQAQVLPSLSLLARRVGLSPFYFHRLFKALTGLTPRAYASAQRAGRVRERLRSGDSVTAAIYDAGYNSNARFYERSAQLLGMTPTAYRNGGAGVQIRFALGHCSLGEILVAATDHGICAILLGEDTTALLQELQARFSSAQLLPADPQFGRQVRAVIAFVEQPALGLSLPLDLRGTAFQHRVWEALRAVPPGTTISYAELARRLGLPRGGRAVARALSANSLAVAVPCHRVICSDGSLSGYRWGVERKRALLEREAGRD